MKRVEVAGHPDKLFGRLVSLVEGGGNTVALCAPEPRARHDIELALVDSGIAFQEALDANFSESDGLSG